MGYRHESLLMARCFAVVILLLVEVLIFILCVSVFSLHVCMHTRGLSSSRGGQKRGSDLLELELYMAMSHTLWVLATEPRTFARAVSASTTEPSFRAHHYFK